MRTITKRRDVLYHFKKMCLEVLTKLKKYVMVKKNTVFKGARTLFAIRDNILALFVD